MAFSASFSSIRETSARFTASFTGGDASFSRYRYVALDVGSDYYEIRSSSAGGSSSSFSRTVSGLSSGTRYTWHAQLGYDNGSGITWLSLTASGSFTTAKAQLGVDPWSWTASNGGASAAQTRNFYSVLRGTLPADPGNVSRLVWNDLVDKVLDLRSALGMGWDTVSGRYLSASGCRVSAGDTLSARKYNSVKYNIGSVYPTDLADAAAGDEITGTHVLRLTETINTIISNY